MQNTQSLGFVTDWRDWAGLSVIAPDGSKYIRFDQFNRLNIYDFDRCTGTLSNPLHIDHPFASPDSAVVGGVSVSPNSRYLYLSATAWVYQYDLLAADVQASRILVGSYDGTQLPFPTTFYKAQLAADGKIYITATNGNRSMHVIHYPDLPGTACGFENNAVVVENYIFWGSLPYFPNYQLTAWAGSGCDTITDAVIPIVNDMQGLKLYPNPATTSVSFSWTKEHLTGSTLVIFNALQQAVYQSPVSAIPLEIDISAFPPGIYYTCLLEKERPSWSKSFVVVGAR